MLFPIHFKGIVHFEIKIWYLSAYPKGIQDVGVFFSSVDPILMFWGQTVLVCQSYNGSIYIVFYLLYTTMSKWSDGCVQEVKNDINTVRFLTQTARFVS